MLWHSALEPGPAYSDDCPPSFLSLDRALLILATATPRLALGRKSGDVWQRTWVIAAGVLGRGYVMSGRIGRLLWPAVFAIGAPLLASAQGHGPDYWAVTGVNANDALNLRVAPNADSKAVGRIPFNARGVKNLGCPNEVTFEQWLRMSQSERDAAQRRARWCQVEYNGIQGWVNSRFLKEDGPPPPSKGVGLAPSAK